MSICFLSSARTRVTLALGPSSLTVRLRAFAPQRWLSLPLPFPSLSICLSAHRPRSAGLPGWARWLEREHRGLRSPSNDHFGLSEIPGTKDSGRWRELAEGGPGVRDLLSPTSLARGPISSLGHAGGCQDHAHLDLGVQVGCGQSGQHRRGKDASKTDKVNSGALNLLLSSHQRPRSRYWVSTALLQPPSCPVSTSFPRPPPTSCFLL